MFIVLLLNYYEGCKDNPFVVSCLQKESRWLKMLENWVIVYLGSFILEVNRSRIKRQNDPNNNVMDSNVKSI